MFRARFVLLNPKQTGAPTDPVDTVEVWRLVEDALPLADGSLYGRIEGRDFIIQAGEWREDREI